MAQYRNETAGATVVAISIVPCLLTSIRAVQHKMNAPKLYLQIFNLAAPTLGITKPNKVVEIPAGVIGMAQYVREIITGNYGGMYMATALAIAVTTTPDGLIAPVAGDEPEVIINYNPLV